MSYYYLYVIFITKVDVNVHQEFYGRLDSVLHNDDINNDNDDNFDVVVSTIMLDTLLFLLLLLFVFLIPIYHFQHHCYDLYCFGSRSKHVEIISLIFQMIIGYIYYCNIVVCHFDLY